VAIASIRHCQGQKAPPFAPDARMKQLLIEARYGSEMHRGAITIRPRIGGVFIYAEPRAAGHRLRKQKHIMSCRGHSRTCLRERCCYFQRRRSNAGYWQSSVLLEWAGI